MEAYQKLRCLLKNLNGLFQNLTHVKINLVKTYLAAIERCSVGPRIDSHTMLGQRGANGNATYPCEQKIQRQPQTVQ